MIVAERLRALQPSDGLRFDQMRDAFRLSKAWAAELRPPEPMAKASVSLADRFRQAHRLTGVMVGERASHAVIDGRLVAVGQALDGFKLVSVTQAAAVFRSDSAQVVLQIPSAVAGAATDPTH